MNVQAGEKPRRTFASRSRIREATAHGPGRTTPSTSWRRAVAHRGYEFPRSSPTQAAPTSAAWRRSATKNNAEVAAAMNAMVKDPADANAIALVSSKDPSWNATLRTTCVATMLRAATPPMHCRSGARQRQLPHFPRRGESVRASSRSGGEPNVLVTLLELRGLPPPPP